MVDQALPGRLSELGHEVTVGTRDVDSTMARTEADAMGNPPYAVAQSHPQVRSATFADATIGADLIVNATNGSASIPALTAPGRANLAGKVLLDIANPLDFSKGFPPSLFVKDTDSLGEQIQREFPELRVVKALNTMNAHLMVNPRQLADADHSAFVAGDDADAKKTVIDLLKFFRSHRCHRPGRYHQRPRRRDAAADLGTADGRAQHPQFNFKIVR